VDPTAGLDDVEKRKFLTLPGLNSDPSVVQPIASRYTNYAIPVPNFHGCYAGVYPGRNLNSPVYFPFINHLFCNTWSKRYRFPLTNIVK
jgi:hypothetical protein